jgi:hypothetical protein
LIRSSMRSQSGDHGGNAIETPSEQVGVSYIIDFPPLKRRQKYGSFRTHDRWRRFHFGQVTQTILWDKPIPKPELRPYVA